MTLAKQDHDAFATALESGDLATVESLIRRYPELVSHPDWTPPPIHCAVLWNQPKVAELLLDHGADIEMRDTDRQTTPLRYAIMYCKTDLIPLLLSRGAHAGPLADGRCSALQIAKKGAAGAYEEFEDLPRRETYEEVVTLLEWLGLTE